MLPSMGNLKACSHFQGWEFQRWKCVFVTEKHIDPKGQYNWLPLSQATAKPSTLFKCMLVRGGASFLKLWHCPAKAWGTRRSLTSQGHRRASNLNCMRGEDEIGYVQISYRARLDLCPFPIFWSLKCLWASLKVGASKFFSGKITAQFILLRGSRVETQYNNRFQFSRQYTGYLTRRPEM